MNDACELTTALGGRWHGRYGAAPCPICQPERRKTQNALTLADGRNGRLVLDCKKSSCAFLDILAAAGLRTGDYRAPDPATLAQREREAKAEAEKRAAQAKRLWQESLPIAGTLAETYLRGRGINCPLPLTLRFNPEAWHGPTARRNPAMVAAVQGAGLPAVHRTFLRTDGTGTGLGLAMVYGFIRQSGGDIAITSAPGAGTSVQLMLPLERTVAPPLPRLGPVLLVEDDSADRAAAQGVLGEMTRDLRIATTAAAARTQLGARLDLLVTDLTLHGQQEGWALAEAALTRWPDCRAIVISGHLPQINPLRAPFAGRVVTMTKPLTAKALCDALAHMTTKDDRDDRAVRRTS